jgi:DSBA-like thioredoxin domain-containing protein
VNTVRMRPTVDWWGDLDQAPAAATWPAQPGEVSRTSMIVYGDFTCPYSYLASQRADALVGTGVAEVRWRAVEHDPDIPLIGRLSTAAVGWRRALAEVSALARPGERVPGVAPAVVSNTYAAVYLYACAATGSRALRQRLFEAVWTGRLPIGSVEDLLGLLGGHCPPPAPSTTAAGRLSQWRREWQTLPTPRLPAVVRPGDGTVVTGVDALAYLGGLLTTGQPCQPAQGFY